MTDLDILKEKRKSSLIVIFTFGLAALFLERIRPLWMTNIFEGTSFSQGGIGFVFKLLSYTILGIIFATVFFIIHLFKVFYYSIEISKLP